MKQDFHTTDTLDYMKAFALFIIANLSINNLVAIVSLVYIVLKTYYLIRNNRKNETEKHKPEQ